MAANHGRVHKTPTEEKTTIEYSVYIHLPANQNNHFWERTSITNDAQLALEQAQMLYFSEKYPRVEVKRTFFCARRKKVIGETLRIFDREREYPAFLGTIKRVILAFLGKNG
jgi:hypothetical protein